MEKNNTRFQKGNTGNPKGRKPGKPLVTTEMREQLTALVPDAIENLNKAIQTGDIQASKIILDKVFPNAKTLPVTISAGTNVAETAANVINETLTGRVPPDIGAQLLSLLTESVRLNELSEIAKRIALIEEKFTEQK
jgi:hypothetical protein